MPSFSTQKVSDGLGTNVSILSFMRLWGLMVSASYTRLPDELQWHMEEGQCWPH